MSETKQSSVDFNFLTDVLATQRAEDRQQRTEDNARHEESQKGIQKILDGVLKCITDIQIGIAKRDSWEEAAQKVMQSQGKEIETLKTVAQAREPIIKSFKDYSRAGKALILAFLFSVVGAFGKYYVDQAAIKESTTQKAKVEVIQ